jgi:hypothetical protein
MVVSSDKTEKIKRWDERYGCRFCQVDLPVNDLRLIITDYLCVPKSSWYNPLSWYCEPQIVFDQERTTAKANIKGVDRWAIAIGFETFKVRDYHEWTVVISTQLQQQAGQSDDTLEAFELGWQVGVVPDDWTPADVWHTKFLVHHDGITRWGAWDHRAAPNHHTIVDGKITKREAVISVKCDIDENSVSMTINGVELSDLFIFQSPDILGSLRPYVALHPHNTVTFIE